MMFARTKRLTLRPGWPEDAPALSQAIGHECVATRLARVPWPYALGDAQSSNPPDDDDMIFPDAEPLDSDTDYEGDGPEAPAERGNEDPSPNAP